MSEWQDIETAPKDGTRIDLWVKWWRADLDIFLGKRIPDCYWTEQGNHPRWACEYGALPINSRPIHWISLPDDPTPSAAP
jgi:hypothetical protein